MQTCTTSKNGLSTGQAAGWRNDKQQIDQTCASVHVYHPGRSLRRSLTLYFSFLFLVSQSYGSLLLLYLKATAAHLRRIHSGFGDAFVVLVTHAKCCLKPTDLTSRGCRCHEESSLARDLLIQADVFRDGKREERKQTRAVPDTGAHPETFLWPNKQHDPAVSSHQGSNAQQAAFCGFDALVGATPP